MKTLDFFALDAQKTSKVVSALQQLLADYHVFYANLRGFHWFIKGKQFFTLHSKFEELYDSTAGVIDEIAERILTLGGEPENRIAELAKMATLKEVTKVSCGMEALKNILDTFKNLIAQERKALEFANDANDAVTGDLLTGYLSHKEKLTWMLLAFLDSDCK